MRPRPVEPASATSSSWRETLGAATPVLALLAVAGMTLSLLTQYYYYGQLGVGLLDVPQDKAYLILSGLAVTLTVAALAVAFTTVLVLGFRLARWLESTLLTRRGYRTFAMTAAGCGLAFCALAVVIGVSLPQSTNRELVVSFVLTPIIGISLGLAASVALRQGSSVLRRHQAHIRGTTRLAFVGTTLLLLIVFSWEQATTATEAGRALAAGKPFDRSALWFLPPHAAYVTLTPVSADPLRICEKKGWRATRIASRGGAAIVLFVPPADGPGRATTLEVQASEYRVAVPLATTVSSSVCVKDPLLGTG